MLMLAIKGLHVQPEVTLAKDSKDIIKIEGPLAEPLGLFGPTGDMYIFEADMEKAVSFFGIFG
jgi:hypothetical protein